MGFQSSTLESFVSHGSGAPGLDIVVDKYHDMVDYIFNKTSWEPGFDNRPARLYLSQTILKDPVSVEPGHYMYSIGGFTVAGAMLEAATNKTFEQLMTEELFEPLGMTGCGFGTDGHNYAQAILIPRFQLGLNIATNNGGGLSESRQSAGFSKTISWIFEHLGTQLGVDLSKVTADNSFLGLDLHALQQARMQ